MTRARTGGRGEFAMPLGRGFPLRSQSCRVFRALVILATPMVVLALSACGNPTTNSQQAVTNGTAVIPATTPTALTNVSTGIPTATAFAGTPLPLRTPALPMESTCYMISNPATPTAIELAHAHGYAVSCYQLGRVVVIGVPGGASDSRPGFLACAQPPAAVDDYCGVGLAPVIARDRSYADRWQFLPFPATDAKEVGVPVFPQQYQCVGNGSQTWTFHLDTFSYSSGCTPPPSTINGWTPCDGFLYLGMGTAPDLYATYGKPAGCQLFGNTAVGVVDGKAQPGVIVCGPVTPVAQIRKVCGFDLGVPLVNLDAWRFVPLPVASGPVASATFDTAAGTACLTVGAQSFTFTLATKAVTPGCTPTPAATATP